MDFYFFYMNNFVYMIFCFRMKEKKLVFLYGNFKIKRLCTDKGLNIFCKILMYLYFCVVLKFIFLFILIKDIGSIYLNYVSGI